MQLFYPLARSSENIGIHGHHDTTKNQSYIPITGCILSHILSSLALSSLEKMYYILADSISYINSSKGRNRSVSLPAKSWSSRLSCSKSEVFVLQKSLEDKGYFLVHRDKNDKGQNNRNIITTTIPDKVFNDLKYEPDKFNLSINNNIETQGTDYSQSDNLDSIDKTFLPTMEGKRQHLEKTKMFIRVPYQCLKQLNSNCSISATSKVIMLHLFTKIYKSTANKYNYDNSDNSLTRNSYSIVTSYRELQKELNLHRNSLSKALKTLEDNNLISKQRFFIKDTEDYNSRADKSLWQISVYNVPLITHSNDHHTQEGQKERTVPQQVLINNQNQQEYIGQKQSSVISDQTNVEYNNNEVLESFKEWECTKYDPACTDSSQLYNKDFILKNSIIENTDYTDENNLNSKNLSLNNSLEYIQSDKNVKKEFLENELCSFSSEFYNNSSFLNKSFAGFAGSQQKNSEILECKQPRSNTPSESATRIIEDISEYKELRHFYPLSEQDVDMLNFRADRAFSNNFINQLLLKLYIKYPEKRFKNKFTFLSYMEKILKNEKHQGPLVNHTSFRFSCNIGTIEKNLLEYEKYLSQIENSFDTSKEMQVRKKIAGRYSSELAYKILMKVEFKLNPDNSFITALIPSSLALSERQIATLSDQLEAVYGINRYYVAIVTASKDLAKAQATSKASPEEMYINTKECSMQQEIALSSLPSTSAWYGIRQDLIAEFGQDTDNSWFSKAVVTESKETNLLTLTMPNKFMSDFIKSRYGYAISRISGTFSFKYIEYNY